MEVSRTSFLMLAKGVVWRETRGGWLLMTIETEANVDSWSTFQSGPSLVGSFSLSADTIDFCPALAALVSPVQNIIFLTTHFFTLLVPCAHAATWAGSRAGSPVSWSLVCGR